MNKHFRRELSIFTALSYMIAPIGALYLLYRYRIQKRHIVGLGEKQSGHGPQVEQGSVMVHGVSLGETMLMKPLVPLLTEKLNKKCLLTTTTETGWAGLNKNFPEHDKRFFPLDFPWAVNRFLDETNPSLVILLELELWPLFLLTCYRRRIPVVVLNARIGLKSFIGYRRFIHLLGPLFRGLHLCLAQNNLWAKRFEQLGVPNTHVCGSMKADLVQRADDATLAREANRLGLSFGERIFLIASTSAPEEEPLIRSWMEWGRQSWRLIICPRHPERGAEIERICSKLQLLAIRTSQSDDELNAPTGHVIIVDEIGCLSKLYELAELTCVGGSFGSGRHGQNMLEAAATGTCTVVGDDTSNHPDSMTLLRANDGIVEVTDETVHLELKALAMNNARRQEVATNGQQAFKHALGASKRGVDMLVQEL